MLSDKKVPNLSWELRKAKDRVASFDSARNLVPRREFMQICFTKHETTMEGRLFQ